MLVRTSNKYLIVTSDAFLVQNNAFKHTVCTALLWKKILLATTDYALF